MVTLPILKLKLSVLSLPAKSLVLFTENIQRVQEDCGFYSKRNNSGKGKGWFCGSSTRWWSPDHVFKNTDKSKSEKTMVVLSAFQQLPLSSLLTRGPPPRPSWLPKPDSEALVFSATPALSQKLQTETWGLDEIWSQYSLQWWGAGGKVLMLEGPF